jgi:Fe-S-cluster containining protein
MAQHLGLTTSAFTRKHCEQTDGIWRLKDMDASSCQFLQDRKCGIYPARPTQCRTWPFWPEVLNAKSWNKEVASFCPGVGKGRIWTAEEIEEQRKIQVQSEREYGS